MPFQKITEYTMGIDIGDINNTGHQAIFATDMKPYSKDTATMAKWLPMMKVIMVPLSSRDPQYAENTLQIQQTDTLWRDEAYERFVDSSGWSWSGKFGDLDNDGFLDLYIVNGMIGTYLFDYLPNNELVEPNLAFHNDGTGHFSEMSAWGLADTASGRGMSMADLDGDGDLDIVVNNVRSLAKVFENQLCGGSSLQLDLRWPSSKNTYGLNAHVALETSAGTYLRDVRSNSGYLSGDSSRLHFGFPTGTTLKKLTIIWSDGATSNIESLAPHTLVRATR
jgi:hypothetical protein